MRHIGPHRTADETDGITFRKPDPSDGTAVLSLIQDCAPLDENSHYFYLVQCDQFRDTCVLAERDGEVVGWVSAHIPPNEPETIFVWQVAVSPNARGEGLGGRMLQSLIKRPDCADIEQLRTTITPGNDASWALFRSFAKRIGAEVDDEPHFLEGEHFDGEHDTEHMVTLSFAEPLRKAA